MLKTRVIPTLLLKNNKLVKTKQFKNASYIGDPINAVKIFNDKEVDELLILDMTASSRGCIDYEFLARVNKEAFMPLAYGGGIKCQEDARKIFNLGYEKIVLNTSIIDNPSLVREIVSVSGSQSVVVCIDVYKNFFGTYRVFDYRKSLITKLNPIEWLLTCQNNGVGEVIVNSVNHDGMMNGFDLDLIKNMAAVADVPLVASGGASCVHDFLNAKKCGASAVAAGAMFVYYGSHRTVLITYPDKDELITLMNDSII